MVLHLKVGRMTGVAAVLLMTTCLGAAQSEKKEELRDCSVYTNASSYDEEMVAIRAVFARTPFEGAYLLDETCNKSMWFTTPEGLPPVVGAFLSGNGRTQVRKADFTLVKDKDYAKFEKFAYATVENMEPEYKVTAIFTGRLQRCKDFKIGEHGFGNGFGHMGESEYQFVIKSVSDVVVAEADHIGAPVPTRSVLPDRIPEKP